MKVIELQRSGDKVVLIGAFPFSILKGKLKFTERHDDTWDPYSPDDELNSSDLDEKFYQRATEEKRVKEISAFIEDSFINQSKYSNSIKTIFPTSMILAFEYYGNYSALEMDFIDVKDIETPGLIVDGQHRFAAMLNLLSKHEEILEREDEKKKSKSEFIIRQILSFKFNCTILLNFDLWDQAELFVNVNFNQRKVNKSLYYDIFGSMPPDSNDQNRSRIFLAHDLVKYLNTSEKSPLKGFIKMLGTGQGYFSQAMLVEAVMAHFGKRGAWSNIEEDYRNEGRIVKSLPRIFVGYYNAIKISFDKYWPKEEEDNYESILCKTTGMGATVRLLGYLYKLLTDGTYPERKPFNFQEANLEEVEQLFTEIFKPISNKGYALFSKQSEFAGAGSAGLQSKLYKALIFELGIQKRTIE